MLAPLDDSFDAEDLNRINGDVHRPDFGAKSGLKFDINTSISMAPKWRLPQAGGNGDRLEINLSESVTSQINVVTCKVK